MAELKLPFLIDSPLKKHNFCFDFFTIDSNFGTSRDVAQPGSVLAWGARGRWFESSHPDFFKSKIPFTKCKWDLFFL